MAEKAEKAVGKNVRKKMGKKLWKYTLLYTPTVSKRETEASIFW